METLLSRTFPPIFPQSFSPLHPKSKSFSTRKPNPILPIHSKSIPRSKPKPKPFSISCSTISNCSYGGWDDQDLLEDSASSLPFGPLRRFLISLGINDGKHGILFLLGFLSAMAVSRVRLSSMLLLPFSVLVFVIGFSAGMAQIRVFNDKFGDLEAFLKDLKDGGLSVEGLDLSRIKGFVEAVESAKRAGDFLSGGLGLDLDLGGGKRSSLKPGRKRKGFGAVSSDLVHFLGGMFQENVIGAKVPKTKDFSKGELNEKSGKERSDQLDYEEEEEPEPERLFNKNIKRLQGNAMKVGDCDGLFPNTPAARNVNKFNKSKQMLSYDEDLNDTKGGFSFATNQGTISKTMLKHNYERRSFRSDTNESSNLDNGRRTVNSVNFFVAQSEAASLSEKTLEISNESYTHSSRSKSNGLITEEKKYSVDASVNGNQQEVDYVGEGKIPPSKSMCVDEEFSGYMKEATGLLKQARDRMTSGTDEEVVDRVLYESASLLLAAVDIRPMSLLAVGQLGNTYLLHGELKLKISRELRALLMRSDAVGYGKGHAVQFKKVDGLSREDVASVLVEVCEECEEFLVQAGRKYRMALSIDSNDVRALYNWGLALSFRAQLIADIGPEATFDADKVYLAAIDKFDAMISRSSLHATDALCRWGIVLQQRSHLHPHNNKEKMKLLHQAKSLFEDVLFMESDNKQAKEALFSCVSELNCISQW